MRRDNLIRLPRRVNPSRNDVFGICHSEGVKRPWESNEIATHTPVTAPLLSFRGESTPRRNPLMRSLWTAFGGRVEQTHTLAFAVTERKEYFTLREKLPSRGLGVRNDGERRHFRLARRSCCIKKSTQAFVGGSG